MSSSVYLKPFFPMTHLFTHQSYGLSIARRAFAVRARRRVMLRPFAAMDHEAHRPPVALLQHARPHSSTTTSALVIRDGRET